MPITVINQKPMRNKIAVNNLPLDRIGVIANCMSNDLFYTFAHTPLALSDMGDIKDILLICLSDHSFSIEGGGPKLFKSWLITRADTISTQNIVEILDQHPYSVTLVSQLCKRYFDQETMTKNYKARIFSLLPGKKWITNKLPWSHKGNIYGVHI